MVTSKPGDRTSLTIEKFGPLIAAFFAAVIICITKDEIIQSIANKNLQMNNLYSAVLSWASIQIGFAFGVYGFVVGKTQGFINDARDTTAMHRFLKYVKAANIGGFVLTAWSLPLAALVPSPTKDDPILYWSLVLWFCLFVWTFFALLRVAYNFGHLSSVRDQPPFHGA